MATSDFLIEMGKRISARRKELRLTQEKLAEAMNVSLQTVSCIELGKKAIRPENLVNLCNVLDTTSDYILMGKISEKCFSSCDTLSKEDIELINTLIKRLINKH